MQDEVFWQLAYHLSGITLLGRTEEEPLGTLPYPVRSAFLRAAWELDPEAIEIQTVDKLLEYQGGKYSYVRNWHLTDKQTHTKFENRAPNYYEKGVA